MSAHGLGYDAYWDVKIPIVGTKQFRVSFPAEDAAMAAANAAWPIVQQKLQGELPWIVEQVKTTAVQAAMGRVLPLLKPKLEAEATKLAAPVLAETKKTLLIGAVVLGAVIVGSSLWVRSAR